MEPGQSRQAGETVARVAQRTGSRALAWILTNLDQFDPFAHDRTLDEFHQTALAELALMSFLLRRGRRAAEAGLERCVDFLHSLYCRPAYHGAVLQEPQAFIGHLLLWLALRDRGVERLIPRDALKTLIEPASRAALRADPYRTLELRYLVDLVGLPHGLPSEQEMFVATPLGSAESFSSLSESQLYSITHTIFYLTDFGARLPGVFVGEPLHRIKAALEAGMDASMEAQNWDLVAEIILAHRCLHLADDGLLGVGWGALSAMQEPDGMVGRSLSFLPPIEAKRFLEDDRYRFETCYHRTLVAVMAARVLPIAPNPDERRKPPRFPKV